MAATSGVDFKALLSRPVASAERPKPKAAGTYSGIIESFRFDTSAQKKTPYVRFTLTNLSPGPDVSQADLDAAGADLSRWKPTIDFYLTEDALYRLREVIENCVPNSSGRSFNETVPEMKGKAVLITVQNENYEDKQTGEMMLSSKVTAIASAG